MEFSNCIMQFFDFIMQFSQAIIEFKGILRLSGRFCYALPMFIGASGSPAKDANLAHKEREEKPRSLLSYH